MTCNSCSEVCPLGNNDDVSGIGVVVGFTAMGLASIAMLVAYYLFAFDPRLNPFRSTANEQESGTARRANPVDLICFELLPFAKRARDSAHPRRVATEMLFSRCILMLADAQLVAGLAIFLSGWYTLNKGLSVYHWQTVVYLGWFSSMTHLSALTFLRTHAYNPRAARAWRLALMTLLAVFLFVGLVPTGHFDFPRYGKRVVDLGERLIYYKNDTESSSRFPPTVELGSPARCFFKGDMSVRNSPAATTMLFSMLLLLYGFTVRVCKLFESSSTKLANRLHQALQTVFEAGIFRLESQLQKLPTNGGLALGGFLFPLLAAVYCTARLTIDLYSSMLAEILSLLVSATWGVIRLVQLRAWGPKEENHWAFGQVVPLVLLVAPLLPVLEYLFGSISCPCGAVLLVENVADHRVKEKPEAHEQTVVGGSSQDSSQGPQPLDSVSISEATELSTADAATLEANPLETETTPETTQAANADLRRLVVETKKVYDQTLGLTVFCIPLFHLMTFAIAILVRGMDLFVGVESNGEAFGVLLSSTIIYTPLLTCPVFFLLWWVEKMPFGNATKAACRTAVFVGLAWLPLWTVVTLIDRKGWHWAGGIMTFSAALCMHTLAVGVWLRARVKRRFHE